MSWWLQWPFFALACVGFFGGMQSAAARRDVAGFLFVSCMVAGCILAGLYFRGTI